MYSEVIFVKHWFYCWGAWFGDVLIFWRKSGQWTPIYGHLSEVPSTSNKNKSKIKMNRSKLLHPFLFQKGTLLSFLPSIFKVGMWGKGEKRLKVQCRPLPIHHFIKNSLLFVYLILFRCQFTNSVCIIWAFWSVNWRKIQKVPLYSQTWW